MSQQQQTTGSLIDHRVLATQHALSFNNQPYLHALFSDISADDSPLTLIVGSGVAMNAGLPSWDLLIDRIVNKIDEPDLKIMASGFRADPLRRAEFVLQLARRRNVNVGEDELIRDGLYPSSSLAQPGPLARSIARLVAIRRERNPTSEVRVITTNFDMLLDEALTAQLAGIQVKSLGLNDYTEWQGHQASKDTLGILHVHGALRQAGDPIRPVILTETHYLKDGAKVRSCIAEALTGATGLFLGLSLTDPNLLGPLYETTPPNSKAAQTKRYALTVADAKDDAPAEHGAILSERSAMLAVESVRFLDEKLKLRPILTRSYLQIDQVVSDLALCLAEPARYSTTSRRTKEDLHYGNRISAAIEFCYKQLGCNRPPYIPTRDSATRLTNLLRDALMNRGGPQKLLDKWTNDYGKKFDDGIPEHYGLHLWLRAKDRPKTSAYGLTLVGSSAFESKDPWYIERNIPIARDTDYAAAQAVYDGTRVAADLRPTRTVRVWRGNLAIPINLQRFRSRAEVGGSPLDWLTVGALTLTTTKPIENASSENSGVPTDRTGRSVIAHLEASQLAELYASMERAAEKILFAKTD